MKKLYIIANWKSHKTANDASNWLKSFGHDTPHIVHGEKEVVVCPPFTLLAVMKWQIEQLKLPLKLGSQDFSAFPDGAYTGEEPPSLLKDYVHYALIGHSERRNHLAETPNLIEQKVAMAHKNGIIPILCIQDVNTQIPEGVRLVAYEPVFAIGTGKPDTPENAQQVAEAVKKRFSHVEVLYGGSVNGENVNAFTAMQDISGVLVGAASLDPVSFGKIVQNA